MDPQLNQRMQDAYDRVVDAYAMQNHRDTPDFLTVPIRRLAKQFGNRGKILDLGCGTGRDMAQFESDGVHAIGGDLSGGMLSFAQTYVSGPLVMMDMHALPFGDITFSGVWACASLLHIPKVEAPTVLKEIWRILNADGMLILSIQEGYGERWDGGYVEGVERFFARYQPDEMRVMLKRSGFEIESVARENAGKKTWLRFTCMKNSLDPRRDDN